MLSVAIYDFNLGPRHNDLNQATYPGFERDVFKTVADYFLNLPEPLLTFEHYELFVNILGRYLKTKIINTLKQTVTLMVMLLIYVSLLWLAKISLVYN